MKFWIAVALGISFLGIALFGVFVMNQAGYMNIRAGCIAATLTGMPCPAESDSFASSAFHLDAFKNFSTATFVNFSSGIFLIAFALVLLFGFRILAIRESFSRMNESLLKLLDMHSSLPKEKISRWLALHENSPAAFY